VASEIAELLALDAFAEVPSELEVYRVSADALRDSGREMLLSSLSSTESFAGQTAADLTRVYEQVPRPVVDVLRPLPAATMARLRQGDEWFIDPMPYVDAARWSGQQLEVASARAAENAQALLHLGTRPPYWETTEFGVLAVGLVLFAITGGLFGVWRLSAATRRLAEQHVEANAEAIRMSARVEQLRTLIAASRQMSASVDPELVARHLVEESTRMFAADLVVVSLLQDGLLRPVATSHRVGAAPVSMHDGVAGRCAEGGVPSRMVVASDPLLPGLHGPLSLLAVPLVREGRVEGVLTIGRTGSELFDQGDETVLGLVALMGSGALGVAERVGTTLALALDDPLTGLGNRRRLDRDLGALPHGAVDPQVAFLMIDIDHFKQFNDRYGHPAGDDLLRRVGDAIRTSLRAGDIAYRFGGEEFSVLLPGADAATARVIAERVRTAVAALLPPPGGAAVTVSVGVSVGVSTTSSAAMVEAADQALYSAKRAGRDRVVVAA
jgi:diguanylate cyclase (GGDEF)-like protein